MAVTSVQVSLKAWRPSGEPVRAAAFVNRVAIDPGDPVSRHKGPGHARVDLLSKAAFEFAPDPDPAAAHAAHTAERVRAFAVWLGRQDPAVFDDLRQAGCVTEVSVFVVGTAGEAVAVVLPPELLAECGRLGLQLALAASVS
jgi:hypothetical protein